MKQKIGYILLIALFSISACKKEVTNPILIDEYPSIYPDYIGVTVPGSISPMNFILKDSMVDYLSISVKGGKEGYLQTSNPKGAFFPEKSWKQLLQENINDSILIEVSAQKNGQWFQYKPFAIYIGKYPIDYGLVYRLIPPSYEVFSKMGIYERNLSSFKERPIYENTQLTNSCINCHSFNQCNPNDLSIHIRGKDGATIIQHDGVMNTYNTKTDSTLGKSVYSYWHPSGKYIAYSTNTTRQIFHEINSKTIEVLDLASDLQIYDIARNELIVNDAIKSDNYETFPTFSPDGNTLFFTSAEKKNMPVEFKDVKYNLCSVSFNPENGRIGDKVDTLIDASLIGKSVTHARPSYDGKYILYTLIDYGNFSVHHGEADLWMLNLRTGENYPLTNVNSDESDTYHSWSSNSHWFVFGSRRGSGLFTRAYIAYVDDNGNAGKPFLLPQKNPKEYYGTSINSFNIPEFVSEPVNLNHREVESKLTNSDQIQMGYRKQ